MNSKIFNVFLKEVSFAHFKTPHSFIPAWGGAVLLPRSHVNRLQLAQKKSLNCCWGTQEYYFHAFIVLFSEIKSWRQQKRF